MMLLLMGNVVPNRTESRLAYSERPIAGLPCKQVVFRPTPVHPLRRIRFYQTSDIGDEMGGGHAYEEMYEEVRGGVWHSFLSPLRGFPVFLLPHPRLAPWATFFSPLRGS